MALVVTGKNLMLDALAGRITHVGLFTANAGRAVTGVASTDVFSSTAHGYSNGDVVLLSGLTGGAGLVANAVYFVIDVSTDRFRLALTSGGAAVDFTTDLSAGTVTRLVELTGGSPAYARQAITWGSAAAGTVTSSSRPRFDVPAGDVNYAGLWTASSSGTLHGVGQLTRETFAAQGTYELTSATIRLTDPA